MVEVDSSPAGSLFAISIEPRGESDIIRPFRRVAAAEPRASPFRRARGAHFVAEGAIMLTIHSLRRGSCATAGRSRRALVLPAAAAAVAAVMVPAGTARGVDATWKVDGVGNWSGAANWTSDPAVPNG